MSAGNWTFYNDFKEKLAKAEIDLDNDTLKCLLTTSSYTPSATHSQLSDITNEVTDSDYARQTLGSVTFDCADISFGSAVTITGKYAVLYDDTATNDPLIVYVDLDTGGGSVSSTNNSFSSRR